MIENNLTLLDLAIVLVYFFAIIWLGSRFRRRQKSTEYYFLGKRKKPLRHWRG
ncbi:hypothetical protein JXO59_05170 [candidate division KSB1 bacterium]|nr:hypothetical protein [candidate division KSB1 bacterium]